MSTSRVFFNNFLTNPSNLPAIVASGGAVAQSSATISGILPVKSGSTSMTVSGVYTALFEKTYITQVYQTGGGFSTTRVQWSDTRDPITGENIWNVSGITPLDGTPMSLNSGLFMTFHAGPSTLRFVLGDFWAFRATLRYGPAKAADGSRDTEWRSGAMPAFSTVEWRMDYGGSVTPTVVALMDHNIPSNATTTLLNTASNFTSVNSSTTIPWNAGRMIALVSSGSSRYWVLRVTLGATALTYLRWSEIFIGTIESFDRTFDIGFDREARRLGVVDVENTLMHGPGPLVLEGDYLTLTYSHILSTTDVDRFARLKAWSNDQTYRVQRPFFFVPNDATLTDFSLYQWANSFRRKHAFLDRYDVVPEFAEVVRSIA